MTRATWFAARDGTALTDLLAACEGHLRELLDEAGRALRDDRELGPLLELSDQTSAQLAESLIGELRQGVRGDWSAYESHLAAVGGTLGSANVSFRTWSDFGSTFTGPLFALLIEEHAARPPHLAAVLQVAHQFVGRSIAIVSEAYFATKADLVAGKNEANTRLGEKSLARLFESGMMGILICDLIGNIKEANDSFLETFGYTRAELVSGEVRWAEMTPPEFRHLDDEAIEQLKARGVTSPWEKEYFHKDGTRIPILVGVALLGDTECIAFVLDIRERRRLEELRVKSAELEMQNRRIQEANRLKSEFLANMSHELRTPLNSIIGFTDLLQQGEIRPDSPQHKEFLGDILSSSRHLLQLINDVLDLAKVEAGKFEFRAQELDLSKLIGEVVAVVRGMSASKRIRIDIEVDAELGPATLDPARLKQVLYNYVSNALKFTNEGGRIWVRARTEGPDMFRLEVEDTGIGIAPSDIGRLFVEFQQLDAGVTKKHSGTGLGLALTRRVVEAQGGSVGVKSVLGAGTVFFATLPICVDSIVAGDEDQTILLALDASTAVLVVEDDARDRALLAQTLHKAGYGVEAVATGGQAISSIAAKVFDAITLDLLLPDMTGLDVLHRIRNEGRNRDTPVIIVSVVADKGVVGGFSVHDYLTKPIDGVELVSSLRRGGVLAGDGGSILVVDDDPSALKLMEATLTGLGYRVACCSGGEQALVQVSSSRPRAIVLDLLMPEVDGFEFLARFRRDPANRQIPVIVWTLKDLTAEDHARLQNLAQTIIIKQHGGTTALVDQLKSLLSDRVPAERVAP